MTQETKLEDNIEEIIEYLRNARNTDNIQSELQLTIDLARTNIKLNRLHLKNATSYYCGEKLLKTITEHFERKIKRDTESIEEIKRILEGL